MARSLHLSVYEDPEQARLHAWVELTRAFYLVQRQIVRLLTDLEMTLPQFDVLATLRFNEAVTQNELAERLLVTKGNVCGVIDRLERLGWVQRRSDDRDGRINRLHLTSAGRRKIGAALPRHDVLILDVMRSLSSAEVSALRQAMAKLAAGAAT